MYVGSIIYLEIADRTLIADISLKRNITSTGCESEILIVNSCTVDGVAEKNIAGTGCTCVKQDIILQRYWPVESDVFIACRNRPIECDRTDVASKGDISRSSRSYIAGGDVLIRCQCNRSIISSSKTSSG